MKKANIFRLLGKSTGFLTIFVYFWCILYVPIAIIMIPKFKYFFTEPDPIECLIEAGERKTLAVDYKYETMDEEGKTIEITVPKGTAVYPLYRHASSSEYLQVRDQKGNEFRLDYPSKVFNIVGEKVQLWFKKQKNEEEMSIDLMSEKNLENFVRGVYGKDNKIKQSDVEGIDVLISNKRTLKTGNNSTQTFVALSADGKFLGYTIHGSGYNLDFVDKLPKMEGFSNPIPLTTRDLSNLAVGKSLSEFYQRYRYPNSVTIIGNKIIAEIPEVYSGRMKSDDRRRGGLLLFAEIAEGEDVESAIVDDFGFTKNLGRVHPLDYIPYGGALFDNVAPLRSFVRGIERQNFFDEKKFMLDIGGYFEKGLKFIFPTKMHDGFIYSLLYFILAIVFISVAGVPLIFIPYLIAVALFIKNDYYFNDDLNKIGMISGFSFFVPCILLFAITETPFVALLAIVVTAALGYYTILKVSDVLEWCRCEDCVAWNSYKFTRYLKEGAVMEHTTTTRRWKETTHRDGSKSTSDHETIRNSQYYRDVKKEYKCRDCDSLRNINEREYLSKSRAEQLMERGFR